GIHTGVRDDALRPAGRAADLVRDVASDFAPLPVDRERAGDGQRTVVRSARLRDAAQREAHAARVGRSRSVAITTLLPLRASPVAEVGGICDFGPNKAVCRAGERLVVQGSFDSTLLVGAM